MAGCCASMRGALTLPRQGLAGLGRDWSTHCGFVERSHHFLIHAFFLVSNPVSTGRVTGDLSEAGQSLATAAAVMGKRMQGLARSSIAAWRYLRQALRFAVCPSCPACGALPVIESGAFRFRPPISCDFKVPTGWKLKPGVGTCWNLYATQSRCSPRQDGVRGFSHNNGPYLSADQVARPQGFLRDAAIEVEIVLPLPMIGSSCSG
jgi:hypothetical protein